MLRDPFAVDFFEVAQLGAGNLVQLLACDVIVDLRRPLTVCAVGAAQVARIVLAFRNGCIISGAALRPVILAERPVGRRTAFGILSERLPVAVAGRTITIRLTLTTVTVERLTLTTICTEGTTLTITSGTITIRLTVSPVTEGLTLTTVTVERLPVIPCRAIAKWLPVSTITCERLTVPLASRAVTEGLTLTTITIERLTLSPIATERTTLTITSGTIAIRLPLIATTAKRPTVPLAGRTITKRLTLTITGRTITVRLPLTTATIERLTGAAFLAEGLTFTITSRTSGGRLSV
ncbi:hypothetical protein [Arthrobacter sp. 7Tela_A1]|uniref:hypothetical protein n=1 Tax=Arthrobacter sp. 7Tela_A1 TaxID=3093745 RepID=UPI003BB73739